MMVFGWIIFSATAIFTIAGVIKLIVDGLYKKKQISTDSSTVIEKYSINANVLDIFSIFNYIFIAHN